MSAQTTYNQATPRGVAGGLVDLSAHAVNTRINGQADATLKFGMGVVQGSAPGSDIKIPATGATADKFEGITVNGYTNEMDMDGAVSISPGAAIGVIQYGKIWAGIKSGDAPPTATKGVSHHHRHQRRPVHQDQRCRHRGGGGPVYR